MVEIRDFVDLENKQVQVCCWLLLPSVELRWVESDNNVVVGEGAVTGKEDEVSICDLDFFL